MDPACTVHDLPNLGTYLELVKEHLSQDKETLQLFMAEVHRWSNPRSSRDRLYPVPIIVRLATLLRFKPRLLFGLNSLLRPRYRLECSTTVSEVKFFVLVEGKKARILPVSSPVVPFPSYDAELRKTVMSKDDWSRMLIANPDVEWLSCIAQLLQEILDDPCTHPHCRNRASKCLSQLARDGIVASSAFMNFVLPVGQLPSDFATRAKHMDGGGCTDIYMKVVKGTPTCFRVIRMFMSSERTTLYKDFCTEITVWRQLKHPNILPFTAATLEVFPQEFCFILPWLRNGSIMSYLKRNPGHDRFTAICEIVDAIEYLHGQDPPVVHKDIKGANILVGDDLRCLVTDFGFSCILDSQRRRSYSLKGSFNWMAPEVISPELSSGEDETASDVYALGCTIYEIFTGQPPFSGEKPATVMFYIMSGKKPSVPPPGNWTEDEHELWFLVEQCLQPKPADRPSIKLVKRSLQDIQGSKERRRQPIQSDHLLSSGVVNRVDHKQDAKRAGTRELAIHVPAPKSHAILRSRGLFTPNTPSLPALPNEESSDASAAIPTPSRGSYTPSPRPTYSNRPLPTPEPSPLVRSSFSLPPITVTPPAIQQPLPLNTEITTIPSHLKTVMVQPPRVRFGSRPIRAPSSIPSHNPQARRALPFAQTSSPLCQTFVLPSHHHREVDRVVDISRSHAM